MTRAEEAAALHASGLTFRQVAERMGLKSKTAARFLAYRASSEYREAQHAQSLERQKRRRQKAQSTDNRSPERIVSDAALEAAIMRRGWQLTQMMRTPLCMWPSEWLSND